MAITVRAYRGADEGRLLDVWNAALVQDPVAPGTFRRKLLLDPNFDSNRLFVAEEDGVLAGFVLLIRRKVPFEGVGLEPERAWIPAFAVHPHHRHQGIGTALFDAAEAAAGARNLVVAAYVPNYFVPGVDEHAYPETVPFLQQRGYTVPYRAIAMDAPLAVWSWPEAERARVTVLAERGIVVEPLTPERLPEFLDFLEITQPPDWLRHAREVLLGTTVGTATWDQILIARRGEEILGYAQFERNRFGPFGVKDACRGQGIGAVLLGRTLEQMRRHGSHCAWFLWTDEQAARLYRRFGFQETRRFAVLRKELG